jgi:cephalosporin hydroxylase
MYTREEFEKLRNESAGRMIADKDLVKLAREVFVAADRYHWIHQTNWFGEPILQLPQDMFAFQEIIFRSRPEFILEIGAAWGGSLLYYSTIFEALDLPGKILAVDVYIPDDLKARVASYGRISKRIEWIQGSSIEPTTADLVRNHLGSSKKVMVNCDSNHTADHVLAELRLYSPLVEKGQYVIVGDTIVEQIPKQEHRPRPWGPGNNPKTALDQFLKENDRFVIDATIDRKLLFTCNPGGFLRCTKDLS